MERRIMNQKTLVEVSVPDCNGTMIPYGIMNSEQAAELPDTYEISVAHLGSDAQVASTDDSVELMV